MIPDPDMQVRINTKFEIVEALTYQDTDRFDEVYSRNDQNQLIYNPKFKQSLNNFLLQWLENLVEQGFKVSETVK